MKEFLRYFLGAGTEIEFTNFSLAHFLPILCMIAVVLLIRRFKTQLNRFKYERNLRLYLALALICTEMSYYWRLVAMPELGPNPMEHLPISVCGWCVIFSSYVLLCKSQALFDICYFWLLSGTVFALLTPTVISYTGPTRFRYYQFWLEHNLGYVALFYMIFVHNMRPNKKSIVRSICWLAVLATIAYFVNDMLGPGANYLFMARPESTPSILDILPPNHVLRICVMAAAVSALHLQLPVLWIL